MFVSMIIMQKISLSIVIIKEDYKIEDQILLFFYEVDVNLAEPGTPIVRLCNDPGHRIQGLIKYARVYCAIHFDSAVVLTGACSVRTSASIEPRGRRYQPEAGAKRP